jgi:hypothetical protein
MFDRVRCDKIRFDMDRLNHRKVKVLNQVVGRVECDVRECLGTSRERPIPVLKVVSSSRVVVRKYCKTGSLFITEEHKVRQRRSHATVEALRKKL